MELSNCCLNKLATKIADFIAIAYLWLLANSVGLSFTTLTEQYANSSGVVYTAPRSVRPRAHHKTITTFAFVGHKIGGFII